MQKSLRQKHNRAYLIGGISALIATLIMFSPLADPFLIAGPMLIGHENLQCNACHKDERGTLRQQMQANVQYLLNNRSQPVSVGYRPVENHDCLKCHSRPNDRHPVHRFLEPKYRKMRQAIGAHTCVSCHREHNNKRISMDAGFCRHCHDELKLNNDPIEVSHEKLLKEKRWTSCLGCHDFHGNHKMDAPRKMEQVIAEPKLEEYFLRGKHPYPGKIIHKAETFGYEKL